MTARPAVSKLVTASVAPLMKTAGFKKASLVFDRRRGDVTQIINIQISHGGESFYVNAGLICDALTALGGTETGSLVIGKYTVHHGGRLDDFVAGMPDAWRADDATAGEQVRDGIAQLLPTFDRIDGAVAMLTELDLTRGFHKLVRAQLKYITGDHAGARADLEAIAAEFPERSIRVERLAKRTGIPF